MFLRWFGLLCLFALASCERCAGRVPEELRVQGPTPYVRCLSARAPEARKWSVGRAQFQLTDRNLSVAGWPTSVKIAAFSGAGFASALPDKAFKRLAEARPRLAIVLGGIGDDPEKVQRTLRFLAALDFPSLVIAGGRERWSDLKKGFSSLDDEQKDRVIDATPLRSVQIGDDTFVIVAGAAQGRYARDSMACGFGEQELEAIAGEIGPKKKGQRRWLLSWQVPASAGQLSVGRTNRGVQTGDEALARFAQRVGAAGGLFAWPDFQVLLPRAHGESLAVPVGVAADDLRLVVPRLSGPAIERDDGLRIVPGFALLVLTKAGMLVEQ